MSDLRLKLNKSQCLGLRYLIRCEKKSLVDSPQNEAVSSSDYSSVDRRSVCQCRTTQLQYMPPAPLHAGSHRPRDVRDVIEKFL